LKQVDRRPAVLGGQRAERARRGGEGRWGEQPERFHKVMNETVLAETYPDRS
jgi:hypothetical protein